MSEEQVQEPVLTPEGQYLKSVVEKFNSNSDELSETEKVLMTQITDVSKQLAERQQELNALQGEVDERQKRAQVLLQEGNNLQGQLMGLQTALLKLKPASE